MTYTGHVHQEVVEELPDVVGGVDLLHLHLRVHIAVVHKVHIGCLYLGNRQRGVHTSPPSTHRAVTRSVPDVFSCKPPVARGLGESNTQTRHTS